LPPFISFSTRTLSWTLQYDILGIAEFTQMEAETCPYLLAAAKRLQIPAAEVRSYTLASNPGFENLSIISRWLASIQEDECRRYG